MPKLAFALALTALGLSVPCIADPVPATTGTPASAGTYSFSLSGGIYTASGTLTTDASGHITDINGLLADSSETASITGLDDLYGAPDNDLFVTPAYVTIAGISFDTDTLGAFNLANDLVGDYVLVSAATNGIGSLNGTFTPVSFSVEAVPEPSTWAMVLLGFGGVAFAVRRRSKGPVALA